MSITTVRAAGHHWGHRYAPTMTTSDGPSIGDARAVVLVEGISDRAAVEALARRRGRDLEAERIAVLAMGGATNVRKFLEQYGPHGMDRRVVGLCDEAETGVFQRGLESAGFGKVPSRGDLEALGFQVCVADLEDELIRALGVPAVERILDDHGDLRSFRTFQRQPAQAGKVRSFPAAPIPGIGGRPQDRVRVGAGAGSRPQPGARPARSTSRPAVTGAPALMIPPGA